MEQKVNLFHDERERSDLDKLADTIKSDLNHPKKRVETLRISNGHRASAVFLELVAGWTGKQSLEQLAKNTASHLDSRYYANDVSVENWVVR